MAGKGLFGASGYKTAEYPNGVAFFTVNYIEHGIEIASTESVARVKKSIYFQRRFIDNFRVGITLAPYQEYVAASKFFSRYIDHITKPESEGTIQPMAVMLPERNFFALGIPVGPFKYGKKAGEFVWTMDLTFTGTINPMAATQVSSSGKYNADAMSPYYYPLGKQMGSKVDNVEHVTFDDPAQTYSDALAQAAKAAGMTNQQVSQGVMPNLG